MTCNQIHQHLTNYLERNCEKSDIVLIARHIESCRGCARQLTEMQQVKSLLKRTRTIEKHPCAISEMIISRASSRDNILLSTFSLNDFLYF